MQAVRALYDGTRLYPLPSERLPMVEKETPVIVIFDALPASEEMLNLQRRKALDRMRAARAAMPTLEDSIAEMKEDGRDR